MKVRVAVVVAALLLGVADSGLAYLLLGPRWPAGSVTMHLQQGSSSGALIDGSSDWNAVTESALGIWNAQMTQLSFRAVRASTAGTGLRNGTNNVTWADDLDGEPFGDAIAVTRYLYYTTSNRMAEADVVFDRNRSWNSYRGNLRNGSDGRRLYDLRRVAIHEFGHVLGLGHPDEHGQSVAAVMTSRVSNTDTIQTDDIEAARTLYGAPVTAPARASDTIEPNARLTAGQSRVSRNARYRLVYQSDGNLVLYDDADRVALWATNTTGAGSAVMQGDGNFVVYDAQGTARFATDTSGHGNARLVVQDDGNLVLYRPDSQAVWHRGR